MDSGGRRTCRKTPTTSQKHYYFLNKPQRSAFSKPDEVVVPTDTTLTRQVTKVVRSKPEFATRDTIAADTTSRIASGARPDSPNADRPEHAKTPKTALSVTGSFQCQREPLVLFPACRMGGRSPLTVAPRPPPRMALATPHKWGWDTPWNPSRSGSEWLTMPS